MIDEISDSEPIPVTKQVKTKTELLAFEQAKKCYLKNERS